ncbi:MAG: hypothetical protein NTZ05_23060 [Chloroflexi bacterium]|nr:hypothetical protein [Chloroflexota bacterium]
MSVTQVDIVDVFRVGLRWIHGIAALTWVGGSLFWYLAIRPALERQERPPNEFLRALGESFGGLVRTSVPVLLISGMVLTVDRLGQLLAPPLYMALLALKVVLALWMIWLNRELALRRRRRPASAPPPAASRGPQPATQALLLGLAVYLLADALKVVFEAGLRAAS